MSAEPEKSRVIGVYGLGYMGLATALAFAHRGSTVVGYDIREETVSSLRRGTSPYYEDKLEKLLQSCIRRRKFRVVPTLGEFVRASEVLFVCLPTPQGSRGRIDLRIMSGGIRTLGRQLPQTMDDKFRVVVIKSTVVPGTTQFVIEPLLRTASKLPVSALGVAVNPEFLSEGSMVSDALYPQRVVIGASDRRTRSILRSVYRGFRAPVFELSLSGAELVKYASNSFLALKVSFANEISRLAEDLGDDVDDIMRAVGEDARIGNRFLVAGPGFGGSCFDKDVSALTVVARDYGGHFRSGEAALKINDEQIDHVIGRIHNVAGSLSGKSIAVLGLAFKAGTDDVRSSRAFPLIERLLSHGARIRAHDPVALHRFKEVWEESHARRPRAIQFCAQAVTALRGSDLAILQADWPEYWRWPDRWTSLMKEGVLFDLRRALLRHGRVPHRLRVHALGTGSMLEAPGPAARALESGGIRSRK
jgi:UDPglucose 6-dehydrogenase